MATISELNVRLGLLYKDFDSALKKVERDLERSGRKFSQLGNDLTLAISAPLAALGAAAIQQAGEIESLKLAMTSTFESAGRSAADATKEVELLREAAKAPGLDFEQAVRGSIRLQGVGFSAEEARKVLKELANTISLTGGTAQELDAVTRQFAQIISKGRVLQEDVTILSENMPKIASLMQQAFGTASVEAIRKAGVTGKEFVTRIIEAAEALPRVEGGIKNALVNAGAEARNALAKLGETLVKTFDLPKTLERLTRGLSDLVNWFDKLSDSTKETIAQTALFVVAVGPVIKVIGVIMSTGSTVVAVLRGIGVAMAGLAGGTLTATAAWQGLTLAMKSTVIGVALAAVTALYFAFSNLSENIDSTAQQQRDLNEINKEVNRSIAKEKSEVDQLIGVIQNETTSRESKLKALEDLRKISPQYFGDLREEEGYVYGLVSAYEAWSESIVKAAKAQAARERLVKIAEEELNLADQHEEKLKELTKRQQEYANGAKNVQASVGAYAGLGEQQKLNAAATQGVVNAIKQEEEAYKQAQATLKARSAALTKIVADNETVTASSGNVKTKTKELTAAEIEAAEEAAKATKKRKDLYDSIEKSIDAVNKKQAELGADFVGEKTKEIESGVEKLIEAGFAPNSAPVQKLKGYLKKIREEIAKGFGAPNNTQEDVFGEKDKPAAPTPVATLPTPGAVQSGGVSGATAAIQQAKELGEAFAESGDAYKSLTDRMAEGLSVFDSVKKTIEELKNGTIGFGDAVREIAQKIGDEWDEKYAGVYDAALQLTGNITNLQKIQGENEKAELEKQYAAKLEAAGNNAAAREQIEAQLAQRLQEIDKRRGRQAKAFAVASAIIETALGVTKALGSAPPPFNFIQAALTAAAGAVQIATIKATPFAKGGVITQPTLGLVGEYPGASRNPEIITPERLMRSVFREEAGIMGGQVEVVGVIRGSDILLSNLKADRERGRIR